MTLLAGKTILVTGILTEQSIAFHAARLAQEHGASCIFTSFGRRMKITGKIIGRLAQSGPLLELDATSQQDVDTLQERVLEHTDKVDGIIHCISASKPTAVGEHFLSAKWDDIETSLRVSGTSLHAVAAALVPIMPQGSSVVGVTLDGVPVWPLYGFAGVAKATYEAVSRYLASALGPHGIRSNLIASGPLDNFTQQAVAGIDHTEGVWEKRAPLGWDRKDFSPVAKAVVALLSDWFPATTGDIVYVDGGYHAMGM